MADAGKLRLELVRDGGQVQSVKIRSTRPQAAALLRGKTDQQVLQLLPLLFSVCAQAQGNAARLALAAARQNTMPERAQTELAIRCEVLQEHLWRLLLDWPKALALTQQQQSFVKWHGLLREIAAGKAGMESLCKEFEQDWLGMTLAQWRDHDPLRADAVSSPAAQLLALAWEQDVRCQNATELLPNGSAEQTYAACAGRWDEQFSRAPEWQGAAAETGAMSYQAGHPALSAIPASAGKRLLARMIDTLALLEGGGASRLDAFSPMPGTGLSLVYTARGLLMHHVRLQGERVADYVIVAPTEWNFHPKGAFVQGMLGVQVQDEEDLKQKANIMALSLDPCVAYEIEVRRA